MISRTWHGLVPISKKDAFNEYLYETGVTIWSEWDDIKKFAGDSTNANPFAVI